MEKNNRTKGEWSRSSNWGGLCYIRKNGTSLGEINSDDADLIVEACNNYEVLLENLKRIVDRIEESEMQDNFPSAYQRAKEAIEKSSSYIVLSTK